MNNIKQGYPNGVREKLAEYGLDVESPHQISLGAIAAALALAENNGFLKGKLDALSCEDIYTLPSEAIRSKI